MRRTVFLFFAFLFFSFTATSQRTFQILRDPWNPQSPIYRGMVTRHDLESDTSFHWYQESREMYTHPDKNLVKALAAGRDSIYFLIFAGTWCEDTHYILPKLFEAMDAAGFSEDHYTIFALDRLKETSGHMAHLFHITATPTILVMKGGKETGRLVEYGKTGLWDKELTSLIREALHN